MSVGPAMTREQRVLLSLVVSSVFLTAWYAFQPTAHSVLWGLSPRRLVVLGGVWGATWAFYRVPRQLSETWVRVEGRRWWAALFIVASLLASVSPSIFDYSYRATWEGLRPFWLWLAWNLGVGLWFFGHWRPRLVFPRRWLWIGVWSALLLMVLLFVKWGGQMSVAWQGVGVPVTAGWVWFSVIMAAAAAWLVRRLPSRAGLWLSVGIWVLAVGVWMGTSPAYSYFRTPELPPHNVAYPASDAAAFDLMSWQGVEGYGYYPTKRFPWGNPFYRKLGFIGILSTFHLVTSNYARYEWLVLVVLALTPVLLFWVVWRSYRWEAGLLLALLMIGQEYNAIHAGELVHTTSHVRLLMSEPWMRLWLVMFAAVVVLLYRRYHLRGWQSVAVGSTLGFAFLVRAEAMLLLVGWPAAWMVIERLIKPRRWKRDARRWLAVIFFVFGIGVVFLPWMGRSVVLTSHLRPQSPAYRTPWFFWYQIKAPFSPEYRDAVFPTSWFPSQNVFFTITAGKAMAAPRSRVVASERQPDIGNTASKDYGTVIKGIVNLAVRNALASILALPPTVEIAPLADTLNTSPFWRTKRLFSFQWGWFAWLMLVFNVGVLAMGMVNLWQDSEESRLLLLTVLFVWGGYLLAVALPRSSGGRYIVPVNWIPLLFYAVGLARLTEWGGEYLRGCEIHRIILPSRPVLGGTLRHARWWALLSIGLSWWVVVLEFGAMGWVVYRGQATPPRWHVASPKDVFGRMDDLALWDALPWSRDEMEEAVRQGNVVKETWGFLYHPFYFAPGMQCEDLCGFHKIEHPALFFHSIFALGRGRFYITLPEGAGEMQALTRLENNNESIIFYCSSSAQHMGQYHKAILVITVPQEGDPVVLASPAASPADACAP